MGDRQRLVIGNLTQYGMVEQVDGMDLPANSFQFLKNVAFYHGRLGTAGRWNGPSSATPIFNGSTYSCCGLWKLYNSEVLKLKAGDFAEYEGTSFLMYEIPCWLGMYSTNASGTFTGNALDGGWSTTAFPHPANKWLTKSDKIFLSSMATPMFAETFTDLGGYAFTVSGVSTSPTAGETYTNNGQTFTVSYTSIAAGSGTIYTTGTGAPSASGTLTKATGTGDATITFSAYTDVVTLKTYSDWTDSSTNILQADTTNPAGDPTADTVYNTSTTADGQAFNSTAITSVANALFTIRNIKLIGSGGNASLIIRDNTTHRGYALQVERTSPADYAYTFYVPHWTGWVTQPAVDDTYTSYNPATAITETYTIVGSDVLHPGTNNQTLVIYTTGTGTPGNPLFYVYPLYLQRSSGCSGGDLRYQFSSFVTTGPFTVTIRLWDGYFDSTDTGLGDNANIVWEKTGITDWGYTIYNDKYYEDLWMWWRDSFITFGYGPKAIGCVTTSATPTTPRLGFSLKNAWLKKASTGKYCIYGFNVAATKTGPYAIDSFPDGTATSCTQVKITSPPADGDYLIWGCKYASRKKIVPASDYVLFVTNNTSTANFPASIWRGGMMEEVPLTNPTYNYNFSYSANDVAIYKGRVFLGGANKMIHKYSASNGCYEWTIGLNQPTLVKWSASYYPNVWEDQYPGDTTASAYYLSGNIDFSETNGSVNAIGQLRDVLIVYKQDAIAMLSPTGIALDPFQVDYMAWNIGVEEARAIAITPDRHFFPKPDSIWQVEIGEVTKTPCRYSVGVYGKTWVVPGENTLFMQAYYLGDLNNLCLAYNYELNAAYYAELKNIVDIVEQKDYVYGITAAGLYIYSTRETSSINPSYICSTTINGLATQIITPVLSMNDLLNNKTIYTVDVFTRKIGSQQSIPSSASIDIRVTVDNTAESDYTTVSGQIVGKEQPSFSLSSINPITDVNLWRFRYHKILTGLTFQVDLRLNSSYLTHEIVRIEIDYESTGTSKQA